MSDLAVTALTVTAALAVGMVMALLGNIKLTLARRPDQGDSRVRNLLSLLNLLLIPLIIVSGLLVDRWGVRPMLISGSVLLSLSILALGAGLSYERTLIAVFAAALGACALHVGTIVQLPLGLFGVSEVPASFQLGLVFVALGALIMPPLLDLLIDVIGFRKSMAVLALFFLTPAFLASFPRGQDFPTPVSGFEDLSAMILDPGILMAGLVFFVYAPLEAFVSVWTTTYLTNLGLADRQSRWLAYFWLAMIGSRFLFAVILHIATLGDAYMDWFLILPAVLSAVILGNMSGTTHHEKALVGLVLLGFFLGPLYPMLLGILFKTHVVNHRLSGSAFALLYTFGSVGSLLLAPLVQLSASRRSLQAALRIPLFIALVLSASTLMFALLADR
jgi:hypothetical protein